MDGYCITVTPARALVIGAGHHGLVCAGSSGYFPLTRASPAFEAIGLERFGVEWVDTPVVMVHPLLDGRAVALHREVEPWRRPR